MAATSLRHQFVFPMLLAVLATALGVTICSKWFADRVARNETLEQLSTTGKLCVNAKYPLTESVLTQIQDLSSLKLAIVFRESANAEKLTARFALESKSSLCPNLVEQDWVGRLAMKAEKPSPSPFFESVETVTGTIVNATAYKLTSSDPSDKHRFLILLQSKEKADATSVQAFALPMVTGLFSSIAIALVAAAVASKIGKRIERLDSHVKRIAEGSFESIAPTGPTDAIHSLYDSVNSMSLQLKQSSSQIAQNERSRMINLMASGLAHELRNHLTGARLAIQTCTPDPSNQEALSIALKQMKLAEESIQRLLTLRVDSADKWTPPLTIQQIDESVRDLVQPIANHQRVIFQMQECRGENGEALGPDLIHSPIDDGGSIVGALINLVLNAIEAAGPGGEVFVTTTRWNDEFKTMQWTVRDNGPGPSEAMASIMFEPFATTKREGVGLGLAMCKRISQRHHGDVQWHRDGNCTVFTMKICTKGKNV